METLPFSLVFPLGCLNNSLLNVLAVARSTSLLQVWDGVRVGGSRHLRGWGYPCSQVQRSLQKQAFTHALVCGKDRNIETECFGRRGKYQINLMHAKEMLLFFFWQQHRRRCPAMRAISQAQAVMLTCFKLHQDVQCFLCGLSQVQQGRNNIISLSVNLDWTHFQKRFSMWRWRSWGTAVIAKHHLS